MKWINKSSVIGFVLGAVISPIVIVFGFYFYMNSQASESREYGLSAPEIPMEKAVNLDWKIRELDGTELNVSQEFDDEVIFLNFWATWCPPCIAEMPSIEDLYNRFKGKVKFVCISKEEPGAIDRFRQKKGYSFPMYHMEGNLPRELDTNGIPATFIISPAGKIKLQHVGSANWAHPSVVDFLHTMLSAKG